MAIPEEFRGRVLAYCQEPEPEEVTPAEPQAPSARVPTRAIAPIVRAGVQNF